MVNKIEINNYKSISNLELELKRFNILIGENGCGKSNILESITFGSAASSDKLDNEFLTSRGVRVTDSKFMKSAFNKADNLKEITISFNLVPHKEVSEDKIGYSIKNIDGNYSKWEVSLLEKANPFLIEWSKEYAAELINKEKAIKVIKRKSNKEKTDKAVANILKIFEQNNIEENQWINFFSNFVVKGLANTITKQVSNFIIFSPENTSLRLFEKEGQIQPLGINGEGLLKLIKSFGAEENQPKIEILKKNLKLINWFEDFEIPEKDTFENEAYLAIKDKFLTDELGYFDQKSSNEGFLFLIFYFSLFISEDTPTFFAIDNIDASLNPKLCTELIKILVKLSKEFDKQVILTTHNPAILDGLDLNDPEQNLLVVYRNKFGHTKTKKITPPEPLQGQSPIKLSEAFLRGNIGGLPKNF